jgi:hypothetical protein
VDHPFTVCVQDVSVIQDDDPISGESKGDDVFDGGRSPPGRLPPAYAAGVLADGGLLGNGARGTGVPGNGELGTETWDGCHPGCDERDGLVSSGRCLDGCMAPPEGRCRSDGGRVPSDRSGAASSAAVIAGVDDSAAHSSVVGGSSASSAAVIHGIEIVSVSEIGSGSDTPGTNAVWEFGSTQSVGCADSCLARGATGVAGARSDGAVTDGALTDGPLMDGIDRGAGRLGVVAAERVGRRRCPPVGRTPNWSGSLGWVPDIGCPASAR